MRRVRTGFEYFYFSCCFLNASIFLSAAVLLLLAAKCCSAQQRDPEGIEQGNYNVKQSVEFGYRFTDVTGSQATYDTFVNLQQGPRLLDFTTEMRSPEPSRGVLRSTVLQQFRLRRRPAKCIQAEHQQEQMVRLQRALPPERIRMGLFPARESVESGHAAVRECPSGIYSDH